MTTNLAMTYEDFELEIGEGDGVDYPVAVTHLTEGEVRGVLRLPFGQLELENRLQTLEIALLRASGGRRKSLSQEEQTVRDFGQALFETLLPDEVRSLYRQSQRRAAQQQRGLRLKLRIHSPTLAALPWEFLYDARSGEYVCLSRNTPLLRYLELAQPIHPLRVTPPLRILGMIANPAHPQLQPLQVEIERERVERALAELQEAGLVELTWLDGQTWRDVQRAMRRGPWHIFHFVGHGGFDAQSDEGLILLADRQGQAAPLSATHLGRLLADHHALRLVFLNACDGARGSNLDIFSSTAATLMRRGIPAVLAMQYAITDRAAIEFAQSFYESLADGVPVDAAVVEARIAVSIAVVNTLEWGTPVLHMRAPDGVVFEIEDAPVVPPAQPPPVRQETPPPDSPPRQPMPNPWPTTTIPFDWVTIPAGEFLMGSDKGADSLAQDDEEPHHPLFLPAYRIAKVPVTVAQFAQFVEATGYKTTAEQQGSARGYTGSKWEEIKGAYWARPRGPGSNVEQKANHPVTSVSWHDAQAFCEWAGVRLPSEAQWEKAASWDAAGQGQGSRKRRYPWGDEFDARRCNSWESKLRDTTPVDKYPGGASPYGVLDMAGNVWEWTSSLYQAYPYKADDGREDLRANGARTLRGGSFHLDELYVRCAFRLNGDPVLRDADLGFRVVVVSLSPGG